MKLLLIFTLFLCVNSFGRKIKNAQANAQMMMIIPKIEKKQDMQVAREETEHMESDVYFIFFYNEAETTNKHIQDYLNVQDKYHHMANFYRTDTAFALIWTDLLDIYRTFDTIVAVHPQGMYIPINANSKIREKLTHLPIQYQYYDSFVQLQDGDFINFVRLHLGLGEEDDEYAKTFPHVLFA